MQLHANVGSESGKLRQVSRRRVRPKAVQDARVQKSQTSSTASYGCATYTIVVTDAI